MVPAAVLLKPAWSLAQPWVPRKARRRPGLCGLMPCALAPGLGVGRGEGHPSAERQHGGREASWGLEQGGPGGAGPAFTLEAASAVAARVDPGRVVIADAPHHAPAVGFHHPQVAAYLPPEPAA